MGYANTSTNTNGLPRRGGWPAAPVVYEIYPRSFYDTTGSGEGDLRGVTEKLGYVRDLGVDAVWIAPFFLSPMGDGGYDVQDHTQVGPRFGSIDDFDRMVERAHELGLRVVIDQVLNHTSHRHAWFAHSVERRGGYDDWYVWRDPKPDGTPPNNWLSQFGPPAWTWNHRRRQYYFHQFLDCQPNLNLRSEVVRARLREQLRFWVDRGVDGFRFDAVTSYLWDESLADNPPADEEVRARVSGPDFNPYTYQNHRSDMLPGDGTEFADVLREWAGEDAWLLGEITSGNMSVELCNGLTRPGGLDAAYTTDVVARGCTPDVVAEVLRRLERPRTLAWWLSSHDQPRHVSAMGDGTTRDARFLAMLGAAMPGPWLLYQGEEIALPQPFLDFDETVDPYDRLYHPDVIGRGGARVPVPWAEGYVGFGFTSGRPWSPMRWAEGRSVAAAMADEGSVLHFYRRLVAFRAENGLGTADVAAVEARGDLLDVTTRQGDTAHRALFNFGREEARIERPEGEPLMASGPLGEALPGRTAAIWRL